MTRQNVLHVLKSNQDELRTEFGVISMRLFGSVARDEAADSSDIDILVEFESTPSLFEFLRLKGFLQELLGTRVDLTTANGLKERARPSIEQEAIHVA